MFNRKNGRNQLFMKRIKKKKKKKQRKCDQNSLSKLITYKIEKITKYLIKSDFLGH